MDNGSTGSLDSNNERERTNTQHLQRTPRRKPEVARRQADCTSARGTGIAKIDRRASIFLHVFYDIIEEGASPDIEYTRNQRTESARQHRIAAAGKFEGLMDFITVATELRDVSYRK